LGRAWLPSRLNTADLAERARPQLA